MELDEVVKNRHSCRAFLPIPVSDETIKQIVEAGRLAPSAKNEQPWKYVCIKTDFTDSEASKKIASIMAKYYIDNRNNPEKLKGASSVFATSKIVEQCAAIILVFEDCEEIDRNKIESISATLSIGASVEHMVLKATELGLGSLWICDTFFIHNELAEYIEEYTKEKGLPSFINNKNRLICAVALGERGEPVYDVYRKPMDDILLIINN